MSSFRLALLLGPALACASALASPPALAQPDSAAQLDGLAQAATEIGSGMALVRRQAAAGDLVGAAATLERILIAHPDADEARLAHAALLCRLDDRPGAEAELAQLAGRPVSGPARDEAIAACGPMARPGGEGGI